MSGPATSTLALRLAGPLQSWGSSSKYNRRTTTGEPTKSGIVGLLAASQGRRRTDPVDDLASLQLAMRVDQPGQLRRDYHTVSNYTGTALPSAKLDKKGRQTVDPKNLTRVTERFYLEGAVFVVAVGGSTVLVETLVEALRHPAFPLALGRRACVPTQPLVLSDEPGGDVFAEPPLAVALRLPWQAGRAARERMRRTGEASDVVSLSVVADDPAGDEVRDDLPVSFDPRNKRWASRRVAQHWARVPTGLPAASDSSSRHDPFALLGW